MCTSILARTSPAVCALICCLWVACSPATKKTSDFDLPEKAEQPQLTEPSALLESAASSLEPSTRASAIGPLILSDPGDTWVQRGLFDPDPWVQRAACFAALQKGSYDQVIEYLARTTDAYVRGEVGATLARTGTHQDALPTLWTPATDAIDAPLALPAAILGNQDALSFLGESLASGEVALEYTFMAAIGESSLPALIPFLQTGEEAVEEELRLAYAARAPRPW